MREIAIVKRPGFKISIPTLFFFLTTVILAFFYWLVRDRLKKAGDTIALP